MIIPKGLNSGCRKKSVSFPPSMAFAPHQSVGFKVPEESISAYSEAPSWNTRKLGALPRKPITIASMLLYKYHLTVHDKKKC